MMAGIIFPAIFLFKASAMVPVYQPEVNDPTSEYPLLILYSLQPDDIEHVIAILNDEDIDAFVVKGNDSLASELPELLETEPISGNRIYMIAAHCPDFETSCLAGAVIKTDHVSDKVGVNQLFIVDQSDVDDSNIMLSIDDIDRLLKEECRVFSQKELSNVGMINLAFVRWLFDQYKLDITD